MTGAPDSTRAFEALAYDSSAARLRATCRFAGVVLLLSPLLPFEVVGDVPVFVWSVLGELHPVTAFAALAPIAVGMVALAGSRWIVRPSVLSASVLLSLAMFALVTKLGGDAAAWDFASLPESLQDRVGVATLTIALAGASLRLLSEASAERAARVMSAASVVSGLAFGLWPGQGEAPLMTCLRFLSAAPELGVRLMLGYGLLLAVAVWPLIGAAVAMSLALAPSRARTALAAEIVTFGLPALVLFIAARNVLVTFGDTSVVALTALSLVLAAFLGLTARSLEILALFVSGPGRSSDSEQKKDARRPLVVAALLASVVALATFIASRPAKKGVTWSLGPKSEALDWLFGKHLPEWAESRAHFGLARRNAASATELAETRNAENTLVRAARSADPGVGRAITALLAESADLDLAGRRWFRLIEAVNEASREARLPYYLDPAIRAGTHRGELERLFLVYPYRLERVRSVPVGSSTYALLDVRRLGMARDSHERLGFSRDMQPFALLVLDEIDPYAKSLTAGALQEPPTCFHGAGPDLVFERCGALLRRITPTRGMVESLVERHELQHQIDGPELPVAAAVLSELPAHAFERRAIDEVNRELSAYLAELVAEGAAPKLALIHLFGLGFARRGSVLHVVGRLSLAALVGEKRPPRELESARFHRAFDELAALPDAALRDRAQSAYEALFGKELARVTIGR